MNDVAVKLKKKDFATDQEVRWCPGCGDYAILAAVQQTFADIGFEKHKVAIVSGIGCASRFPYYMNTYGFTPYMDVHQRSRPASRSPTPISRSGS